MPQKRQFGSKVFIYIIQRWFANVAVSGFYLSYQDQQVLNLTVWQLSEGKFFFKELQSSHGDFLECLQ